MHMPFKDARRGSQSRLHIDPLALTGIVVDAAQ